MKARELDDRSTKSLNRDITNFEELPEKSDHDLRVISYNITVDFFDLKI